MTQQDIDDRFICAQRRINWWVDGMFIHGIPSNLFAKMPTERIVELYNVEMSYFKPNKNNTK